MTKSNTAHIISIKSNNLENNLYFSVPVSEIDFPAYLTQIPGIGAKSAQRIILELKDKLKKENAITQTKNVKIKAAVVDNNKVEEAMSALQVLGYNKKEIEKAFMKLDKKELSTEELIRKGLGILSK